MPADGLISVEMSIQEAKALIALRNVVGAQEKVESGQAKIANEARKAEQQLESFAKKITAINTTPQERYTKELEKTELALKKNLITEETASRNRQRARAELERLTQATETAAATSQRAGTSLFATDKVTSYITGLATLQTGMQMFNEVLAYTRQESQAAREEIERLFEARQDFAQIADSSAHQQSLNRRADETAVREGLDRKFARQLLTDANNQGWDAEFETVARASLILGEGRTGAVAGDIPEMFDRQVTPLQALNAVLEGANASKLNFVGLADKLPKAAEGGKEIGASPAELITVLSVLASRSESAADRMKAFGVRASLDPRLRGKGYLGTIDEMRRWSEEDRRKFLGDSQEMNVAYGWLTTDYNTIKQRLPDTEAAIRNAHSPDSLIETRIRQTEQGGDPMMIARRSLKSAEAERAIANEQALAGTAGESQVARDRWIAAMQRRGNTSFARWGAERGADVAQGLGLGETGTNWAMNIGSAVFANPIDHFKNFSDLLDGSAQDLREGAKELKEAAKENKRAGREADAAAVAQ